MRRVLLLLLLAAAAPDPAVYTCHVAVTGSDARNRAAARDSCVRQVLVKLSGDPAQADDPRPVPGAAVQDFAYLDDMTDVRTHDEQGTRDRPFDFVGHVEPVAAEAVLHDRGIAAWTAPRPVLAVRATVTDAGGNRYDLTGDGAKGERQRRALLDGAARFALPVALPAEGDGTPPAPPALVGTLRWSDIDLGWNADWTLRTAAGESAVSARGVSFDAAFRAGLGHAAGVLARP